MGFRACISLANSTLSYSGVVDIDHQLALSMEYVQAVEKLTIGCSAGPAKIQCQSCQNAGKTID